MGHAGPSRCSHRSPSQPLRLAYTDALENERAITAAAFWHRAVAFFAACDYTSERERRAALGGRPPISRTSGSDNRMVFDESPEPLDTVPQQLTFEDAVEPTS
ncbi:hypothetical protein [Streptomyces albicerus]|uniref:hypothetical protein n=1 Tax=Streptomyces albicerus TaxID=2569859 RepID=UPI00124B118B|nr:hypothetical protein [Streptomyces albicerus]